MRKKLLIGLAEALIAVFALSSVAFASVSISGGPSSVDPGDTVSITISGTGEGVNGNIQTSGLELVGGPSSNLSSANVFVLLPDFGTDSVTYTYRVTAQSGTVSVNLTGVTEAVNGETQSINGASWSATVNASEPSPSQQPTQQPTQQPSTQPTGEPSAITSATASSSANASLAPGASVKPGTSVKPGANGNQDKMPKTGDATMDLWVLAVVAAGALCTAVVAGKKVFSR